MEEKKTKKTEDIKAYMKEWRKNNKDKTKKHMKDFLNKHHTENAMLRTIKRLIKQRDTHIDKKNRIIAFKDSGLTYNEVELQLLNDTIDFLQKQIDNITKEYIDV